jgi:hypothetical protein
MTVHVNRRQFLSAIACLAGPVELLARDQPRMTRVGDYTLSAQTPPTLFVEGPVTIDGVSKYGVRAAHTQLLKRVAGRSTYVALGAAVHAPGSAEWTAPLDLALGERATVMAAMTAEILPHGTPVSERQWRQIFATSATVDVAYAWFARAQARILTIGDTVVRPGATVSVTPYEVVKIQVSDAPTGAVVQLVCEPDGIGRRWPSDHIEFVRDGAVVVSAMTFGRSAVGSRDLDRYKQFGLCAAVATHPLPVRPDGLSNLEWVGIERHVKYVSPPVPIVRATPPNGVRIRITQIGASTNGTNWLTDSIARVEGLFEPGSAYLFTGREVITLLTRRSEQSSWIVAGTAQVPRGSRAWTVLAAELGQNRSDPDGEFKCFAVLSYRRFDPKKPVTEADIAARQVALSSEHSYVVVQSLRRGR